MERDGCLWTRILEFSLRGRGSGWKISKVYKLISINRVRRGPTPKVLCPSWTLKVGESEKETKIKDDKGR